MANAYICRMRSDMGSGAAGEAAGNSSFQLTDLTPNSSQYSIYESPSRGFYQFGGTDLSASGQSGYVGAFVDFLNGPKADCTNATATPAPIWATDGTDGVTQTEYTGLAAYLLDNVERGGAAGGPGPYPALTPAEAANCAARIIVILQAGGTMDLAAINAAIVAGSVANTELTTAGGSASSGSVEEVLQLLSGATYTLPSGSAVEQPLLTFNASRQGSFSAGKYRTFYQTTDLDESMAAGELATYTSASFSYKGTTGAAVVVYEADGSVKS